MSHAQRGHPGRSLPRPVLLQAAVTLLAVEAVRTSGPLLDHVAGARGVPAAAVVAVAVYLAPVLLAPAARWFGTARATTTAVALSVLARLAVQLEPTPELVAGAVDTVVALAALVLVSAQLLGTGPGAEQAADRGAPRWAALRPAPGQGAVPRGGTTVAAGVAVGGAVDVAVRSAFGTWDPVWRPGLPAWLYTVLVCAAVLVLLVRNRPLFRDVPVGGAGGAGGAAVARLGLLGPYLALYVLVLGSPAFVASQAAVPLPYAAVALLAGALLGIEAVSRSPLPGGSGRLPTLPGRYGGAGAAVLLVAAVLAVFYLHGVLVLPAVLVGQVAAVVLLARLGTVRGVAARRSGTGRAPVLGITLAGLGVGVGFVAVVLLYQMTYEIPLPFDNRLLPVVAAALLGVAATGARPGPAAHPAEPAGPDDGADADGATPEPAERAARRGRFAPLAGVPALLLLIPALMLVTAPAPAPAGPSPHRLRLVTWNVHYGVGNSAAVDPGAIGRVLRAQRPDVVLLQEVDRGWPIGGGTDLLEWLSRDLAMPYVWSPAADGQFGNAILSRLPLSDIRVGRLPYGAGPQRRSYASARVELASGQRVRLITAHLQDHADNRATRLAEISAVLRVWRHASPAVIAGDFNAMPGWPEIARFDAQGLVSAQDSGGHGGMLSSPTDHPRYRPDWIFGTTDVSFSDFTMPRTTASDHFPLVVTVDVG